MTAPLLIVWGAVVFITWLFLDTHPYFKTKKTTKYDSKEQFKPLQDEPLLDDVEICPPKYDETTIVYIVWNNGKVGSEAEYIEYKPIY
jgi:hypothetical protein